MDECIDGWMERWMDRCWMVIHPYMNKVISNLRDQSFDYLDKNVIKCCKVVELDTVFFMLET